MQVFISSGTHVDEVSKRVDAINQHLESPDVVFGEAGEATQTGQIRKIVHLFPWATLISLAAAIQVLLVYPVGGLILSIVGGGSKGRDKDIMQRIKKGTRSRNSRDQRSVSSSPGLRELIAVGIF